VVILNPIEKKKTKHSQLHIGYIRGLEVIEKGCILHIEYGNFNIQNINMTITVPQRTTLSKRCEKVKHRGIMNKKKRIQKKKQGINKNAYE